MPVEVRSEDGSVEALRTDPYAIQVVSVGVEDASDIRDIRGPLGIPISSWVILLWVLVPLMVAALLYAVVRRLKPGARVWDARRSVRSRGRRTRSRWKRSPPWRPRRCSSAVR